MGVGMIGLGTVGGGVAQMLAEHAELYARRCGKRLVLRSVVVRDVAKAKASGLVDPAMVGDDVLALLGEDVDVVVEVAGGVEVAKGYVEQALRAGKHVVTANKALLAAHGPELFALARGHGVSVAFEASCGGGIPCVTALMFGLMGNAFVGMYGILNGTCNYILTEMTQKGRTYGEALADAKAKGYAEADETLDVSGADAAQKLAVLASLAFGVSLRGSDVPCEGIETLDLADVGFGAALGYDIKLIASAERGEDGGGLFVSTRPCFVSKDTQLAQVHGADNALSVVGDAVGHVMLYGPGAGRGPTASAVVSDLLNVASGWYGRAFAEMGLTPDLHEGAVLCDAADGVSRFYLRLGVEDVPGNIGKITTVLGERGISLSAVMQRERKHAADAHVPVVITTHACREGDLREACEALVKGGAVVAEPVVIRVLDFGG